MNLWFKLGGAVLKERLKPGPKTDKPLNIPIKTRIDKETNAELDYCQTKLNVNRSEAIRQAIHHLYRDLTK